ncbi:MAG: F0F1 ATP synthase subunit B [Firmicutes bacterium]|nr:F0F1 ATP synthase subunit B [Bacillota bacterium]
MNQIINLSGGVLLEAAALPPPRVLGFDYEFLRELGFQWLNTIVMVAILAFLLYKPVKNFMRKRAERVSSQIAAAEAANREAAALKNDYEAKLLEIEKERGEVLDAARAKAVARSEEIIGGARGEADLILDRARNDIVLEAERVRGEMRAQLIELSAVMAESVLKSELTADGRERLVNEALADLGDARWAE